MRSSSARRDKRRGVNRPAERVGNTVTNVVNRYNQDVGRVLGQTIRLDAGACGRIPGVSVLLC